MAGSLSRPLAHRFTVGKDVCTLTLDLPSLSSMEGVDVDMGREVVRISLPGDSAQTLIAWPTEVIDKLDVDKCSAKFSRKTSQLIIRVQMCEPLEEVAEADKAARTSLGNMESVTSPCMNSTSVGGAATHGEAVTESLEPTHAAVQQRGDRQVHQSVSSQKVQGSGWNANSWHWEERPMINWSQSWFEKTLSEESVSLLEGLADVRFIDTSDILKGDISLCVRKGRPVVLYELSAMIRWEAFPRVAGSFRCTGKTWVKDFTSEEGAVEGIDAAVLEIDVNIDTSKGRCVSKAAKQEIAVYTRSLLKRFLEELVNQAARSKA